MSTSDTQKSAQRDIYMAVMVAAANGRGLRLSAEEVFHLSLDDAVSTRAANALTEDEFGRYLNEGADFWVEVKPFQRSPRLIESIKERNEDECLADD